VVVSLGPQGGGHKRFLWYVPAPMLLKKSTVGAGDSMVGGMVWALNKTLKEVLRWGVRRQRWMNTQLFKLEDAKGCLNGWTNNEYNRYSFLSL
jgi:6-phosphofructokinase 2